MNKNSAHKNGWEIAEVIFGVPFLVSIALHFVAPVSFPEGVFRQTLVPVGVALIITGTVFVVLGRCEFARYHQPTDPGQPTSKIVKTGVFSNSRNPLYLGCVIVLLGITLSLNMLWGLVMLVFSIVLCLYVLIFPEEKYLAARFGDEYKAYTGTVHRWFGRKGTASQRR